MVKNKGKRKNRRQLSRVMPLILIGSGLIILGVLGFVLWPKTEAASDMAADTTLDSGGQSSSIPVQVEFPAPNLKLSDLDGKPVSLDDYRGQIVLVNNWATWCPPCKAEMPSLQAYYDSHRHDGFTIVAIDAGDSAAAVQAFVRDYGLTFPVWSDPEMEALDAFRNKSLPSSYVIDGSGTVRLAWTGAISREMLEKHVTPLLED